MASAHEELDQPLLRSAQHGTIGTSLQNKIMNHLWGSSSDIPEKCKAGITAYFAHFQKETSLWMATKQNIAIDTYNDFICLARHLSTHKDKRRDSPEILAFFPPIGGGNPAGTKSISGDPGKPLAERYPFTSQEEVKNAIELTIGLWLMVYWGPSNPDIFLGFGNGRWHVEWPNELTLEEAIGRRFKVSQASDLKRVHFPSNLNAYNLERIGGFHIMWTSSLSDHLSFDEETMTIVLYHFASVLNLHECNEREQSILPEGLAKETCRTLALLLPRHDAQCDRWFTRADKRADRILDPNAISQSLGLRGREIESFEFWKGRLSTIAEAFDNVEPRGFKTWWFDRRNGAKWTNFWMAMTVLILTAFFGLISAVTGIFQAIYASRS